MKEHKLKRSSKRSSQRFESDTQKVVRRHLENKDDVITDEDLRNIRVGLTPPVVVGETQEEKLEDTIKEVERESSNTDKDTDRKDNPITPWDLVDR